MNGFWIIGERIPSVDGLSKVTGRQKFLPDMHFPGMLHGRLLRSPWPHASITRIDATRARMIPGVRAVLTAADIPQHVFGIGPDAEDQEVLCTEKVRFVGDPVAAVAADTRAIAEKAIEAIEVEYTPLPSVHDSSEALKTGAPRVHEDRGNNVVAVMDQTFGDIEQGFAESDFIFEDTFVATRQAHCCMETRGCIAQYEPGGKITVWGPTQGPHNVRSQLAKALNVDKSRIRVIDTPSGGAFGQKVMMDANVPIAVYLSRAAMRPVKIVNTREEEFIASKTSYEFKVNLKTGLKKDGVILAKQAEVVVDNGAYSDQGFNMIRFSAVVFAVLYDAPNVRYKGTLAYTNNQPSAAFRGFGNQQISFAFESHLDLIADRLGLDPLEIRLRNPNTAGHTRAAGAFINTSSFRECLNETARLSGWAEKRLEYARQDPKARYKRGIGLALMNHTGCSTRNSGFLAGESFIKISEDGVVSVITPIVELGQGGKTAIAQIVAEALGVGIENIRIINGDTEIVPFDLGAYGSRQTFIDGHASLAAALEVKRGILSVAATMLECEAADLDIRKGQVFFTDRPDEPKASFRDVAQFVVGKMGGLISGRGRYADETAPEGGRTKSFSTYIPTYTFGSQAVEVEVDCETGQVKLLEVTAVTDSGRTINNMLAEGQIEGAVAQGLGYALTEEYICDNGRVRSNSFKDYKVPRAEDVPKIEQRFVETNDLGPYGVKGIGESGLVPTQAAVANAVYQATGVSIKELPITPEKLLRALKL